MKLWNLRVSSFFIYLFIYLLPIGTTRGKLKLKILFSKVKKSMQPQSPHLHLNISKYFNCADFLLLFKEQSLEKQHNLLKCWNKLFVSKVITINFLDYGK